MYRSSPDYIANAYQAGDETRPNIRRSLIKLLHITLSGRYTIVLDSPLKYGSCSLLG